MTRKRTSTEEAASDNDIFDDQIATNLAAEEAGGSHAAEVGKKQYPPIPDPRQFAHDNLAGVKLLESRRRGEMILIFDEKPSPEVIAKVKEHGFRWNNPEKSWTLKIAHDTANQDRVEGHRAYRAVVDMIRAERGRAPAEERAASF